MLSRIQIPESLINLAKKEVDNGLSRAQDEISNTMYMVNDGSYTKIGVDIAITHLRGVREFISFLEEINKIPDEEDPDDSI